LPAIIEEVDRTITFYNSGHKESPLDSAVPMFVSGDLVQATQSWPALAGKLNCPVSELSSPMEPFEGFDANEYMVNIGLALKVLSPSKKGPDFSSLVNFNALPQAYLPRPISLSNILVPVGVVVFAALLVYIGLLAHQKANDNSMLRSDIASAQSRVTEQQAKLVTSQQQLKQVEDGIGPVQATANTLYTTLTSLEAGREQLDGELTEIIDLLPGSINLSAINHQAESITVVGTALDENDIFTYVTALGTRFPGIVISSIEARQGEDAGIAGFDFVLLLR
jgi:type IV pilus assembly protein PilM